MRKYEANKVYRTVAIQTRLPESEEISRRYTDTVDASRKIGFKDLLQSSVDVINFISLRKDEESDHEEVEKVNASTQTEELNDESGESPIKNFARSITGHSFKAKKHSVNVGNQFETRTSYEEDVEPAKTFETSTSVNYQKIYRAATVPGEVGSSSMKNAVSCLGRS